MDTVLRIGGISDPVHGFIEITSIEKALLDRPIAQRLRNITQSGLVHYVFPEVRTSRFSHCLGTMHLASRLLSASLRNTPNSLRDQLLAALTQLPNREIAGISSSRNEADKRILTAHYQGKNDVQRAALVLIEQALRLAAFFHDLGHLPYSHDAEYALIELRGRVRRNSGLYTGHPLKEAIDVIAPPDKEIHEEIGYRLAHLLLRDFSAGGDSAYLSSVALLAFSILHTKEPRRQASDLALPAKSERDRALLWLHSLIDSELDADRCDYLLRDGRNYGFEFAPYNLERLLANVVVARLGGDGEGVPASGEDSSRFALAVRPQGVSSLESFLLSRFRSYQYGVKHHKVAQIGAALRFSIERLIEDEGRRGPLREFISDLHFIMSLTNDQTGELSGIERDVFERFATYDETWLMTVMRDYLNGLPEEAARPSISSETLPATADSPSDPPLHPWLALVCRRAHLPKSLWKRTNDFAETLKAIDYAVPDNSPQLLALLRDADCAIPEDFDLLPELLRTAGYATADNRSSSALMSAWNRRLPSLASPGDEWGSAVQQQRARGVLLVRHSFTPWKGTLYVQDKGAIVSLGEMSTLVQALQEAWDNDVQVQAFTTSGQLDGERIRVISELSQAFMSQANSAGGDKV